jgi:hypothetical protein
MTFDIWQVALVVVALGPPYILFRMRAHNDLSVPQTISRARR